MVVLTLMWMSTLSQGRWRGIYTTPRNIWTLEHLMNGSTGTQAVVPLASGTTGPVPDQVPEKLHLVEPASDLPGNALR